MTDRRRERLGLRLLLIIFLTLHAEDIFSDFLGVITDIEGDGGSA